MQMAGAEIEREVAVADGPGTPADALARFQHDRRHARRRKPARCRNAGGAGSDHDDIDVHAQLIRRRHMRDGCAGFKASGRIRARCAAPGPTRCEQFMQLSAVVNPPVIPL